MLMNSTLSNSSGMLLYRLLTSLVAGFSEKGDLPMPFEAV